MERWNETTKADKKQKTPGTGERNRIDQEEKEREEKSMEGRGKSRRRSPYRVWKRRGSALLAVLLTLSLMLGDISGRSRVVMAGQGTVREEFRIHREDILKAAEEAIENGEPLSEPLAITSEEEKTEEKYQEILPADGSVYEIFPDIEQVKEVDSLELRIFIRLAEGADPASYTLTGDETLVFLYVNGGDVTAEGRVNIDGYVSEFTKVAAFESEEEPMQPAGPGAAPGNGAAGSGNGSGNGAAGGSGNAGNSTEAAESESNGSGSMNPEDSAADLDGETEAESEKAGDGTSEDGMSPDETLPAETQEPSQEPESSAAKETEETEAAEQPSGQTPDDETPGDQPDGSEADGTASDEKTAEAGPGSADEDKETAGNTENSDAEDNGTDNESNVNESDAADDASKGNESSAEDNGQADPADTENENAEADKEDGAELEKSDTAENADSDPADEDNGAGSAVTLSLRNIQKVAASLASPSEAETPEADESQEEQEESEADEEDSYYEDNGDPVDEEDAAEAEDEEGIFKKTHDLKGRKYDEAVLDETVTVRAFAAGMEDAGFNRDELLEGAHQLTYTVAEGEARLIYTPEYVRDEAVVTFGIIPAEGMEVYQVTANGEVLAETEETAAIASASQAKRAKASSSDADYDEERAVYYQIPQVLEDQTVEIQVVEEGYNDHPAFLQSRTVNGVTVTVSAEEGILPAGTELSVEEVTEQVADAVAEKVEAEAPEEEPVSVTSVLAYDINLMLDGKKLANSYWEGNSVSVRFSGDRIEDVSREAQQINVLTLETPTETVEAALGDVEEIPVVTDITADKISVSDEGRKAIRLQGDSSVDEVSFEAEHFTIYVLYGENAGGNANNYQMKLRETIVIWNGHQGAKWSVSNSSNDNVVLIDARGDQYSEGRFSRNEAAIVALREGWATIKCTYQDGWRGTRSETITIYVSDNSIHDAYFYILKPGGSEGDLTNASWRYVGQGKIDAANLINQEGGVLVGGREQYDTNDPDSKIELYPDENAIIAAIRTLYELPNDFSGTISYIPYKISYPWGAPDENGDNIETVGNRYAYHVDMVPQITSQQLNSVNYFLWDAGENGYDLEEAYTVEKGSQTSPQGSYPDTKIVNGILYQFDGWYLDEGRAGEKVVFPYTVEEAVNFYAKYVPATQSIIVKKILDNYELFPNANVNNVEFSLIEANDDWIPKANAEPIDIEIVEGEDGVGTSQEILLDMRNAKYLLSEVQTADGYRKIETSIRLVAELQDTNLILKCENSSDAGFENGQIEIENKAEKRPSTITITNYPISVAELPETGGPGLIMMERFGWMLLLLALVGVDVQLFSRRRRKEQ